MKKKTLRLSEFYGGEIIVAVDITFFIAGDLLQRLKAI